MTFEIYRHIGNLSDKNNGWTKELNFISWNEREPVYDIRSWNEDHTKMGKGITISSAELKKLQSLLNEIENL